MKNFLKKIKTIITTFLVTLISLNVSRSQEWYWVPDFPKVRANPTPPAEETPVIVNLAQRILPVITFIVWIASLIIILRTKDKEQKKKRIKIAIIVMSILIVGTWVIVRLLNK